MKQWLIGTDSTKSISLNESMSLMFVFPAKLFGKSMACPGRVERNKSIAQARL